MKTLSSLLIVALCSLSVFAQRSHSGKPYLFKNYPKIISCSEEQLNSFFSGRENIELSVPLTSDFAIKGLVRSTVNYFSTSQTVWIMLPEFNNAIFAITRRYDSIKRKNLYAGNLFGDEYADGYELKRNGDSYQMVKVDTDKMLPICIR